jgi:hypothetical protein
VVDEVVDEVEEDVVDDVVPEVVEPVVVVAEVVPPVVVLDGELLLFLQLIRYTIPVRNRAINRPKRICLNLFFIFLMFEPYLSISGILSNKASPWKYLSIENRHCF